MKEKFSTTSLKVISQYRRDFDLSTLPEGNYVVELSKRKEHYTQTFAINPPVQMPGKIAMTGPIHQKTLDKPIFKKLIVSQ